MSHLLLYYQRPEPATWVFLASFLLLSIYFVFHRFFCVRNLDILLLVLLAPGLMMVYEGRKMKADEIANIQSENLAGSYPAGQLKAANTKWIAFQLKPDASIAPDEPSIADSEATQGEYLDEAQPQKWSAASLEFYGFAGLLIASGLLLIRMLIDPALVRRPLLVPNLSIGGLSFIGISLFMFLMANVITSSPRDEQTRGPQLGPGYALLNMLPSLPTTPDYQRDAWEGSVSENGDHILPTVARILAIVSNLAIVLGIVGIGYWHFDNVKTGIGCAVMYLLLPYSAQMTGNLEHVMPASCMVLALLAYRQPLIAGALIGFGAGLAYYPLFLLPLWISFIGSADWDAC
ncbi:MAG: hypothetical protein R3C53_11445 [Pirellulaceae bacterium]